jgi:predicted enzyme related to lactoylglutathione lyase
MKNQKMNKHKSGGYVMATSVIAAILIETARPEILANFYRKGLGLPAPQQTGDHHIGFDIDRVYLGFERIKGGVAKPSGTISIWFYVEDIKAAFNRFVETGALVIENSTLQDNGEILAKLQDLDGNLMGLIQKAK